MKLPVLSRRKILQLMVLLSAFPSLSVKEALALRHSISNGITAPNGGKSQINLNVLQGGGEYPFINLAKLFSSWGWQNGNTTTALTPDLFDADYYPTTLVNGGVKTAGLSIPSQTTRPGNYVLRWSGNGTTTVVSAATLSYSVTAATKASQCVITLASTTVGNGPAPLAVGQAIVLAGATGTGWSILNGAQIVAAIDITGLLITINLDTSAVSGTLGGTITASNSLISTNGFGRCVFKTTTNTQNGMGISAIGVPHITNMAIIHVDDEAAYNSGQIFGTQFLARLKQAKPAVIRFLNWQNGNGNNCTTWDNGRRPETYYQYQSGQTRVDYLCNPAGSGITTSSGSDYTVSGPTGFTTLNDKQIVHVVYNSTSATTFPITLTSGQPNFTWTAHGLQNNNWVYLTNDGGTIPSPFVTGNLNLFPFVANSIMYVNRVDADTISLSATPGGAPITPLANSTGLITARSVQTINVGGTGQFPILSNTRPPSVSGGGYITGNSINSFDTLVYDDLAKAYNRQGTIGSPGLIQNGVPFSLFIKLSALVGAHPHFVALAYTVTPMTDWHKQAGAYCRDNGPSWMVPRFEGPNEVWNTPISTLYAGTISTLYGWGLDINNWYGKVVSTIGQDLNSVWPGDVNGVKYKVLCGCQATNFAAPTQNDPRLKSTKYLTQTPQAGYLADPAYKWCTSVTLASYINPWQYGYNQECQLAFSYYVTNSSTGTDPATYVNGLGGGGICTVSGTTFTMNGHGFVANQAVAPLVSFPGTFPTGISGAQLYILPSGLTANTFQVATSEGGAAISASGGTGTFYICPGAGSNAPNVFTQKILYQNAASWAANISGVNNNVKFICTYEGGYAPVYPNGSNCTSTITGATNANPCVLTLPTATNGTRVNSQSTVNNPMAVVGMYIKLSGLTGNFAGFNGQTVHITGVSGASVTTDLDASGVGAFSGSGTATYYADNGTTPMGTAVVALRYAGKNVAALQTHLTNDYNNLVNTVSGAVVGENPSCFQMGGNTDPVVTATPPVPSGNVWSVLEDIYQTPDPPQWLAITAFNQ